MSTTKFRRDLERAIVRALIQELDFAGFMPHEFDCDGEGEDCTTEATAMAAVFAVDDGWLYFRSKDDAKAKPELRGVRLIGGNGEDIISDWHCGNALFYDAVRRVAYNVDDLLRVELAPFVPCPTMLDGASCTRPQNHGDGRHEGLGPHVTRQHKHFYACERCGIGWEKSHGCKKGAKFSPRYYRGSHGV